MGKWLFWGALGLVVCLANSASAGDGAKKKAKEAGQREHKAPTPERVFKKMDADRDGLISLDEFKAAYGKWYGAASQMARRPKPKKADHGTKPAAGDDDPAARCPVLQEPEKDTKTDKKKASYH